MAKGKGCLIGIAVIAGLGLLALIAAVFMFNKAKNVFEDFSTGIGISPEIISKVEDLNNDYPFESPDDNILTENQIETYIAIKRNFFEKVKLHEEEFKELDRRTKNKEAGWQEVTEAYKVLGDIRRDFLAALGEHKMSPKEYAYLTQQIYSGYFASTAQDVYVNLEENLPAMQENLATQKEALKKQLDNPDLPESTRESLQKALENYDKAMAQSQVSAEEAKKGYEELPKQNIELLNKYRNELEQLNTLGFEYWGLTLGGYQ